MRTWRHSGNCSSSSSLSEKVFGSFQQNVCQYSCLHYPANLAVESSSETSEVWQNRSLRQTARIVIVSILHNQFLLSLINSYRPIFSKSHAALVKIMMLSSHSDRHFAWLRGQGYANSGELWHHIALQLRQNTVNGSEGCRLCTFRRQLSRLCETLTSTAL